MNCGPTLQFKKYLQLFKESGIKTVPRIRKCSTCFNLYCGVITMSPQENVTRYDNKQPLIKQHKPGSILKCIKLKANVRRKRKVKCVLVGDQEVGKTSLAVSYSNDTFPNDYIPTAYDTYKVVVKVDGEPIQVEICDTAGEHELNPLRNLCYPGTDVFILCFSVVKPCTFQSASTRWADELSRMGASVVLVGTQSDLRSSELVKQQLSSTCLMPVSKAHARNLAIRLNAPYVETSAKTCNQLKEAFDEAITIGLKHKAKSRSIWKRFCCV